MVLDTYSPRVFCVVAVKMLLIRYFFREAFISRLCQGSCARNSSHEALLVKWHDTHAVTVDDYFVEFQFKIPSGGKGLRVRGATGNGTNHKKERNLFIRSTSFEEEPFWVVWLQAFVESSMTTLLSPSKFSCDSDTSSARFHIPFQSDKPNLTSFFAIHSDDSDAIISNEWWHVLFVCVPSKLASLAHFSTEIQFDAFISFFLFKACQAGDRARLEEEIIEIDFVTRDVRWWIMMLHQHYAYTNNCRL